MKKILWITTGGTIASRESEDGLVPESTGEMLKKQVGGLISGVDLDVEDLFTLDSSNIQPEEWRFIARRINEVWKSYDGVVLTHGTDTMAYTASALSYLLLGIPIPVVLTGSQLPLEHPLSDGVDNLRGAFAMASSGVGGVYVVFNRRVLLGTRAVKVRTQGFDAFESVNQKQAGFIDSRGLVIDPKVTAFPWKGYAYNGRLSDDVLLIKLIPGCRPQLFDCLLEMEIRGVVVEAFGIGGLSFIRRDLTAKLEMLLQHGIAVVVCSQCLYENSDFSRYEVGKRAVEKGVIQVYDMTSEAAVAKLMWALGQSQDMNTIRRIMQKNYVNDINERGNGA